MSDNFQRVTRQVHSVFKNFCKENFGDLLGEAIYIFIMFFRNKKQMNMLSEVTPESQRRIAFVKYLYDTYGLDNLLLAIDIFYKQVRLNIISFDKTSYRYFKQIVATPNFDRIKITDDCWPAMMNPYEKNQFKRVVEDFSEAYSDYKNNPNKYNKAVVENFDREDQLQEKIIPIQLDQIRFGGTTVENYVYQCTECFHTNKAFNAVGCENCGAEFDYDYYKNKRRER